MIMNHIAQIATLSFQGRHRTQTQTGEVRWAERFSGHEHVCISNIGPTKPIEILNQHAIFENFVCVIQIILLTKIKNLEVGTGAQQQNQGVY